MNFKIESKSLNITNYPIIAKHFEAMASKGWLIYKLIGKGLFIYKKIEPESLDFSIAPYEIETVFTKKTKKELEEFETVCKNVGWNFVTHHLNLHIYYKEAGSEATPIQTDEEEEFKTIEEIAEKQIKASYLQTAIFILLAWMQMRGILTDVRWMKDGLIQIVAPALVMAVISDVINIFRLKKFLNVNKKNIEMGAPIEYSNPKTLLEKIMSVMFILLMILFVVYISYSGIGLNNKIYLIAMLPMIVGLALAVLYRMFVKPSSIRLSFKKILLAGVLIISTVISTSMIFFSIDNLADDKSVADIEGLKVLSVNDFSEDSKEDENSLMKNSSILIPKSYDYGSYVFRTSNKTGKMVKTEYAQALNETLAESLVKRYIKEREKSLTRSAEDFLDYSFEEDSYQSMLEVYALSENDFNNLKVLDKKEAKKMAREIIKERSIRKDSKNLWDLDEAYFLSFDRKEIVLREGREVFYLEGDDLIEGKDFTDPELIKEVKAKLGL